MAENTAANIAQNIVNNATGKNTPPAKAEPAKVMEGGAPVAADPNAGKEKYVVDGKDIYLSPEQAKAYVQKGLAFEPKVSQLSRLQQETASFLKALQDDPGKVIYNEKFGSPKDVLSKILNSTKVSDDIKETIGQWYYNNIVVKEQMSPQERELAEYKQKAAEYEAQNQQRETERLSQENEVRVTRALNEIKSKIAEAMQEAGVPMESKIAPQLAKRVAQIMQLGFVNGKTVTPKEAMAKAKAELLDYQKSYLDGLDEDKLVEQLGKENAEKVRKYFLKQVKDSEKKKTENTEYKPTGRKDERKTMTPDQFRDYLQDLKKK